MRENEEKKVPVVDNSVSGLNDNLEFLGRQLHVQTERIGFPAPRIVTQVFSNGRVVLSKKSKVAFNGSQIPESSRLQELMRSQHLQVIREIKTKQKNILSTSTRA